MSFGLFRPSRLPWYIVCIDVMPPMPVPCVLATRLGCTHRISSVGVKPEERNASTVATMFRAAIRGGVKAARDLAAAGAGQLRLARHPDLGARLAGDLPVAAVGHRCGNRA